MLTKKRLGVNASGTNQFLTWHRMYLWYFERVLQDAAGDASLRLPYWDYEADGKLPAAYRDATYVNEQGQTVSNPLRVNARQPRLNDGTSSLSAGVTSMAGAMPATTFNDFSALLETTPHGAVHCAVVTGSCPNGLMGSVPVAALDPIFYAHHTNIDRLYECWLQVNEQGRLPNDTNQLDTVFTFVELRRGHTKSQGPRHAYDHTTWLLLCCRRWLSDDCCSGQHGRRECSYEWSRAGCGIYRPDTP